MKLVFVPLKDVFKECKGKRQFSIKKDAYRRFSSVSNEMQICIKKIAALYQEYVTLKVLDTGSGIPDYALSRIFERFYSLPRANGQKSSGLGLAFVSEVARLFNGEVTLRNVQEGGVLASLRLHRHFT
ncbi:hypothetical protein E8X30_RS00720 [Escherichia coli]|nr:hypothetical protein [Escherichia coli]EFF0220588.1 hypothetical protein [Escherichia coli]